MVAASCVSSQSSGRAKPGSRPCGPSAAFLSIHVKLRNIVASKLILDWIAGADFRMVENPVSR